MTKKELYDLVDSLTGDVEFKYKGIHGTICPFSRADISISYGNRERSHSSIEEALSDKMYDGMSLYEIVHNLEIM